LGYYRNTLYVGIAIILLASFVYAYGTSNPTAFGHSAGELGAGTFDNGTFVFQQNVNVSSLYISGKELSNNAGILEWGGVEINGSGSSSSGGGTTQCPSGFTKISSNGYELGCISDSVESSSASCTAAIQGCYNTYGGRLPSYSESYVAHQYYTLNNETISQWIDAAYYDTQEKCGAIQGSSQNFQPSGGLYSTSLNYRCFIPSQGSTGGTGASPSFSVNTDDGNTHNITNGWNTLNWTNITFDTNNDFNISGDRFQPTISGKYFLSAAVALSSISNENAIYVSIYQNGNEILRGSQVPQGITASGRSVVTGVVDVVGSSDYFEVRVFYPGSSTTLQKAVYRTYFTGSRIDGGNGYFSLQSDGKLFYDGDVNITGDLHVNTSSLYLGDKALSNSGGQLLWGGEQINSSGGSSGGGQTQCPSGFTKISSNGYELGCMQGEAEGLDDCRAAITDCFNSYGGRLPAYNELYIAFTNYVLANETGTDEWTDTGAYDDAVGQACGTIDKGSGNTPTLAVHSSNLQYRCFIPSQGSTGGTGASPSFRVFSQSGQTLPTDSIRVINWTNKSFDTNNDFNLSSNTFIPSVPGKYLLTANAFISSLGNTYRLDMYVYKNDLLYAHTYSTMDDPIGIVSTIVDADGDDYFDIRIKHKYGSDRNLGTSEARVYLAGSRIDGGSGLWTADNQDISYTSGNVGIGTSNPSQKLEMVDNATLKIGAAYLSSGNNLYTHLANHEYYDGSTWIGDGTPGVLLQMIGEVFNLYRHNGTGIHNLSMTVDAGGNMGIGTSSPNAKLTVQSDTSNAMSLFVDSANGPAGAATIDMRNLNNTDGNANGIFARNAAGALTSWMAFINVNHNSAGSQSGAISFSTENSGSYAERMRISPEGNVGIGQASPAEKLHITVANNSYANKIQMDQYGAVGWDIGLDQTSGNFNISINSGEMGMIIDRLGTTVDSVSFPNGNVSIGTTSPTQKLHVEGNLNVTGSIYANASSLYLGDKKLSNNAGTLEWGGTAANTQYCDTGGTCAGNLRPASGAYIETTNGGNIWSDGNLYVAGAACDSDGSLGTCSSDRRLKENIIPIENAVEYLIKFNPVNYNFIGQSETLSGLIAQDVEAIDPSLIMPTGEEDYITYTDPGFKYILIQAIKELKAENDALKEIVCLDHPEAEACNE